MHENAIKQCNKCKEVIKIGAVRCRHCSSLQGWRRLLKVPLVVLTVILTVASIFSSDVIKRFVDPKSAIIQSIITDGDHHKIELMLTNEGTRAATLLNITISGKTTEGYLASYSMKSDLDGKLMEPGKTYSTTASSGYLIPRVVEHMRSEPLKKIYGFTDNCRLLVEYIDTNGQHLIRPYPFMCDPISNNPKGGLNINAH